MMAAAVLLSASCAKEAIDPLQDIYEKPEQLEMSKLLSSEVRKYDGVRCFVVEIATEGVSGSEGNYSGDGSVLTLKFVGNKYFLENATYTAAPAGEIKKGFYMTGAEGSSYTRISGGKAETKELDHGGISVETGDGLHYTINGPIWLKEGGIVKLNASVELLYEPDPEPIKLVNVLSANANPGIVSMQLAQDGISSVMNPDWSTTWYGEGYYLALDLYSPDGYLHEGTYTACAVGGVVGEGEFGIGYDTTVDFGWGPMEMKDWGTCLWTVADGAASAQKVLSGEVVVSRDGNKWTIELKSGEGKEMLWTTFTGEIPALTDPGSTGEIKYKELTKVLSVNPYNAGLITLQLATDEVSSEYNPDTRQTTYFGTGNFLALDVYSADGTLAAGTYTACSTGGVVGEGEFGIGYDTEMWGMQFYNWGTCWWTVEDGATSAEKVLDGKLVVSVEGGIYTIALESSTVNAKFVGSLE